MAYSDKQKTKIIDSICTDVMNGKRVLESVKRAGINKDTFFRWLQKDKDKSDQYARAMEVRADLMAEEILEICDSTEDDIIINDEGKQITNHNVIQRDRLRVDTRKWLMAKLQPKKYSEKQEINHKNNDKDFNSPLLQFDPIKQTEKENE